MGIRMGDSSGKDSGPSHLPKSILIAASGSGGHLMPARLIGEALVSMGITVSFVGSGRPLEEEIFRSLSIPMYSVKISGLNNLGILGALKFAFQLPGAILSTVRILRKTQAQAVIGVGGYASVLPVLLGWLRGLPTWIHEAELAPGNANRFLSRFATVVSLAFPETKGYPVSKARFTGHPLRPDVAQVQPSQSPSGGCPKNILVLGGSQGARALDEAMVKIASELKPRGIVIRHQCRPESATLLREEYEAIGIQAEVVPFIHELGEAYAWADLVVARAGAGTILEIGVVNRPAILVPFPFAQGLHQHRNAETLEKIGKAKIVEEGDGFVERLHESIFQLLVTKNYFAMKNAPQAIRPMNAAQVIAEGVLHLLSGDR
ncbi:MAG: UDP-N-acetylglucosamine--N-acetylmuramyl-(pentapeptide) pyrophosphoryl-undecaprenol N-acetylglucosamine transferase, partial [Bdellovibrionales bacterium]|nr:UDP-N-acetylglucosamine--N-acetylmuramyl-(pentapeptide) pyrophosphoryl-undecaprenol N-acetylglucosamine transferase [Bdellovibrionales bacterium]